MAISENGVSFFGSGGHSHNGINSTIIDVGSYSLFDFSLGYVGSQSRINRQSVNQTAMEEWVIRIVNSKVLTPAGLSLAPDTLSGKSIRANTITADQIATNTITANELSSNIILVNNIIRSNNYDGTIAANGVITGQGTAGWAITYAGSAEFSSASIRGAITANSVSTPGIDILSNGAIVSTNFNVTPEGNVSATNASLTGTVTATSGSIGGWSINASNISAGSTSLYSNGVLSIGSFATIGANADISSNLTIGNNVRINGAAGDGGLSVLKIRADSADVQVNSYPLNVVSFTNQTLLRVRRDARIDMGSNTDPNAAVYVNGTLVHGSDRRMKHDIAPTSIGLDFVKMLNPVEYKYINGNTKHFGFIAQDVRDILDSYNFEQGVCVKSGGEDSYYYLNYQDFISPIVKAIQELSNKVDSLEARLQALEDV